MISKSFHAFIKTVYSRFTLEELTGLVTKDRVDQIILNIKNNESVSEEFFIGDLEEKEDSKTWYGLKVEWNKNDRSGILIVRNKSGTDWYQFNLGSLHLNRLYELVPDMDKSEEEELNAVAEEEYLNRLMKWKR